MTKQEFQIIITSAQHKDQKAFDAFYKTLSKECIGRLLSYVSTKSEAEEAFSETMYKFWKIFVIEGRPLPDTNIKGYIFTMAKYYCINQQKKNKKVILVEDVGKELKNKLPGGSHPKSEKDFLQEDSLEEDYKTALKRGIQKLKDRCRKFFEFVLENNIDKPRELWEPLGYKNAGTVRSVKAECQKALKLKVMAEMEKLLRAYG